MKIIDLTDENRQLYFLCLEDWSEEMKESGSHKEFRYSMRIETLSKFAQKIKILAKNRYILIFLPFFLSCAIKPIEIPVSYQIDGKYDAEFPNIDGSRQLEEISNAVKQISNISFYKDYLLPPDTKIEAVDISKISIKDKAIETDIYNNSVYGTATIIYSKGDRIALLTCAHIVDSPDTILYYKNIYGKQYIESISIKIEEKLSVVNIPERENSQLNILKADRESDIAILVAKLSQIPNKPLPVFKYPIGKSSDLKWGSFVYLIGYPMGHKMITSGLVSYIGDNRSGSLLIDVAFNKGMSGGIVLAIRDGIPNFELVGLAKSSSAETNDILTPVEERGTNYTNVLSPYEGESYVKQISNINYGVSFMTSSENILRFLENNRGYFLKMGYDFKNLTSKR